jgi:hypothetical protein
MADVDAISAFWDDTMCHTLVHELSHEQPNYQEAAQHRNLTCLW